MPGREETHKDRTAGEFLGEFRGEEEKGAVGCEISNEKAKERSEWLWLPPTAFSEYSNNRTKGI